MIRPRLAISATCALAAMASGCATTQKSTHVREYEPATEVRVIPVTQTEQAESHPEGSRDCDAIAESTVTTSPIENGIRMVFSQEGSRDDIGALRRAVEQLAEQHNRYHLDSEAKRALYDYLFEGGPQTPPEDLAQPITRVESVATVEPTRHGAVMSLWALEPGGAQRLRASAVDPGELLRARRAVACGARRALVYSDPPAGH